MPAHDGCRWPVGEQVRSFTRQSLKSLHLSLLTTLQCVLRHSSLYADADRRCM